MPELKFPSSSQHFAAFRDRIRLAPSSIVDADWLMRNLGISQRSNATTTLRWLKGAGFLDDEGRLSSVGKSLLAAEDSSEYRQACLGAITALEGDEFIRGVRDGAVTSSTVEASFQVRYGAGSSAVKKALRGLAALAAESGDEQLMALVSAPRTSGRRATTVEGQSDNGATRAKRNQGTRGTRTAREQKVPKQDDGRAESTRVESSEILRSGIVKIEIDGTWKTADIREVFRMLQMIEAGERISGGGQTEDEGIPDS